MSNKKNNIINLDEVILDRAGESLEKIAGIIDDATETLPEEDLLKFLKEANEILEPLAEQFKKISEKQDEPT